jgi:alpha-galactosidase
VYGAAQVGGERLQFQEYINKHRPLPDSIHFNYNSWWTSPIPFYTEQDILDLLKTFDENLYKPYSVPLDTFSVDMGWSDPNSIWQISKKRFPEVFSNINNAVQAMKSNLGLWISPSNCYSPNSIDSEWAQKAGYEIFESSCPWNPKWHLCCMAGTKYGSSFKKNLIDII